jgi:hypothetical protein
VTAVAVVVIYTCHHGQGVTDFTFSICDSNFSLSIYFKPLNIMNEVCHSCCFRIIFVSNKVSCSKLAFA